MSPSDVQMLRRAWGAFARGDVDAAADVLHAEVRWYGAREPDADGSCANREQARAFIERSIAAGVTSELLDVFDAGGGRLVLTVLTHAPPGWELNPEPHGEVVTVSAGKVTEMVMYPTVQEALETVRSNP